MICQLFFSLIQTLLDPKELIFDYILELNLEELFHLKTVEHKAEMYEYPLHS